MIRLRELLRRNLPYKIVSLVVAVLLYSVAVGQRNPQTMRDYTVDPEIRDLPSDLIVTAPPRPFKVTVSGAVRDIGTLPAEGPVAWVSIPGDARGALKLPVRYDLPNGVRTRVELQGREMADVTVERKVRREFLVSVPDQQAPSGFRFTEAVVRPTRVTLSGPESQVNRVQRVVANVDEGMGDGTIDDHFVLVARDADQQVIEGVQIAPPRARVRLALALVTVTRALIVSADVSGREAEGFQLYDVRVEPKTIAVAGPQELLDSLTSLSVPIVIEGLARNAERRATPVLPAGLRFAAAGRGQVIVRLLVRPVRGRPENGAGIGSGAGVPATPPAAGTSGTPATGGSSPDPTPVTAPPAPTRLSP